MAPTYKDKSIFWDCLFENWICHNCFVNILKSFSIPLFEKVFKFLGHRDPQRHKEPEDRMMDSWDIKESQTQKQSQKKSSPQKKTKKTWADSRWSQHHWVWRSRWGGPLCLLSNPTVLPMWPLIIMCELSCRFSRQHRLWQKLIENFVEDMERRVTFTSLSILS